METHRAVSNLKTIIQVFVVTLLTGFLVRFFIVDSFVVKGNSMSPTIFDGDYVFINKAAYIFSEPMRYDVVAAKPRTIQQSLIKRIIGLPGERVEIQQGVVRIKDDRIARGTVLQEQYVDTPTPTDIIIQLDPKEYFLLGDNRLSSTDSRELGPFDGYAIEGKLLFRISPKQIIDRLKRSL